jgi:3-dehydroquinate dehydratase-2
MARSILVIHGVNLDQLGTRQPDVYGRGSLADLNQELAGIASAAGVKLETIQSNYEPELVKKAHASRSEGHDFIIINPAAFTHTSVALRDALAVGGLPFIEVHLSNVYARETFRHHSYFSDAALAVVSGLGFAGYRAALSYAIAYAG